MVRIGRVAAGVAAALAAAGCSGHRLRQDPRDQRILELTEENHGLKQELGTRDGQIAALQAQIAERARPAPQAAPHPAARPGKPVELPKALRDKGVQSVTRDGHDAIVLPGAILFGSGQASLGRDARTTLRQVADFLEKQFPSAHIRIEGHTDNDPIRKTKNLYKSNQELSEARAGAVRDYFAKEGKIAPTLLEIAGRGESKPLASNKTAAGKRQNRRVELVILP